jgi:D-tyrosyl-tRNA(Tyr) deacylase
MRALLQRVSQARVRVHGAVVGEIGAGYVALIAAERGDAPADVDYIARKIAGLRVWPDAEGRMNHPLPAGAAVLAVSQFTLCGDTRRGFRPSFDRAAPPEQARPLYEAVIAALRARGIPVATGVFQAHMEVELVNDGPVTVLLDSRPAGT